MPAGKEFNGPKANSNTRDNEFLGCEVTAIYGAIMQYRTLGRTGQKISEIGYGAWGIGGGWGHTDDDEAKRALHRFLDLGGAFIDTAYGYGDGHSEQVIGQVLRERKSAGQTQEIVIAS